MLNEAIDRDIRLQGDEIERRMGAVKAKGQALDTKIARDTQAVRDAASARWQRWSAVEKVATAKAALPGAESRRAGYAQLAAEAAAKKLEIVEKMANHRREEAMAGVARDFQARENSKSRAVQYTQIKEGARQFDTTTAIGAADKVLDRADKYNLAQIKADAKEGAGIEPDGSPKDYRAVPPATGWRIVGKDGREVPIRVPKEAAKETGEKLDAVDAEMTALGDLRRAVSEASWSERTFNTDAEFVAAVENVVGPRAKILNKGATSETDAARAYKSALGYDPNSIISQAKKPSKEEILKHIDNQISASSRSGAQTIRRIPGVLIPPDADVVYTHRSDLGVKQTPVPTTRDGQVEAGITPAVIPVPKSASDVRSAYGNAKKLGTTAEGNTLPDLPDELDKQLLPGVEKNTKRYGHHANEVAKAAVKAIDAWEARQKDPASAKRAASDARARVDYYREEGVKRGAKLKEVEAIAEPAVMQRQMMGPLADSTLGATAQALREAAIKTLGIDLDPQEALEMARRIHERAKFK
jgi:hypothetical protein